MGLLDDAIREHLELKRRHGADPQEVARQEDEALGSIGDHESHDEHEHEDHGDPEDDGAHEVHEHQQELDLPPVAEEPVEEPAHAFEPVEHHERDEPAELEDSHQPTIEYSVEDEHAAEGPPATDEEPADELEETPEFLQETPEHDRLWFEQKPPRDFDF
jgi:hypothetical protein